MTTARNMPVWAKILLGIPVAEQSHLQHAEEPSDNSALAHDWNPDLQSMTAKQYLMFLDQAIRRKQPLRPLLPNEVAQ